MPSEKSLTVKNLKVKESKKVPTEVLTGATTLYGEDSSKIFTFGAATNPYTVTLPSAETGRTVKFIYNATANANLASNVTLATKGSDLITGSLVTLDSTSSTPVNGVVVKNGTSNANVVFLGNVTVSATQANATPGALVDFVCTTKGLWTVTGVGYVSYSGGSNIFA